MIAKRVHAFVPARGGSKSIPLKNIKSLGGKPLIQWVLEAAEGCALIEKSFVSTDSEDIRQCVEDLGLPKTSVIERSAESATDHASSELPLLEFCEQSDADIIVFIQATSPLVDSEHLREALQKFMVSDCDSMLSVVRQKRFLWNVKEGGFSPLNYDPQRRPRRQDFEGHFLENGAFYIASRQGMLKHRNRLFGEIDFYEMPDWTAIEIDEPSDWMMVEQILTHKAY